MRFVSAIVVLAALDALAFRPQNPARIAEIEAMLDEVPHSMAPRLADRAAWEAVPASTRAAVIARAEKILKSTPKDPPDELYLDFTRNGNRTRHEKVSFALDHDLDDLLKAECFENRGRFVAKLAEYIEVLCGQRSWVMPAHDRGLTSFNGTPHIDLGSCRRALGVAIALDLLGDRLPGDLAQRARAEVNRRAIDPYLETCRCTEKGKINKNHWWFTAEMNWNSVCNCESVRTVLALVKDRHVRAEAIEAAERSSELALKGYTPDGYCSEGMGYWNYGYGHQMYLVLAVRDATHGKVDLSGGDHGRKVMQYAYNYNLLDGISPPFADGCGNASPILLALGGQIWPDLVAPALKGIDINMSNMTLFMCGRAAAVHSARGPLPTHTWFPDGQVLISRSLDGGFAAAMKGGHNDELHNHNDLGSFVLLADGRIVCGDPGGEVYTRKTFSKLRYVDSVLNSYAHPVPCPNGILQKDGRKFAAKILGTSFTDAADTLELDLSAAYPDPKLKSLVRVFVFDRAQSMFTVEDRVEFTEPSTFESPLVTLSRVLFDYDNARFDLDTGKRRVSGAVETDGGDWRWKTELLKNPTKNSPTRMAVEFTKPVVSARVKYTLSMARKGK